MAGNFDYLPFFADSRLKPLFHMPYIFVVIP